MDAAALAMEARNRYGTWRAAAEATGVDHATLWRMAHGVGEPEAINVRRLTLALKGETMQDNYGYQVVEGRDAVIDAMIAENARLTGELAAAQQEIERLRAQVPPAEVVKAMRLLSGYGMPGSERYERAQRTVGAWLERQPKGEHNAN